MTETVSAKTTADGAQTASALRLDRVRRQWLVAVALIEIGVLAVAGYLLYIMVGSGEEVYLASWKTQAGVTAAILLALGLLVTVLSRSLLTSFNAQRLALLDLAGGQDRLQASERRYRALFDHMQIGFVVCEVVTDAAGTPIDHVFLAANEGFGRMTGFDRRAVIGRRISAVFPAVAGDATDWIGLLGGVALGHGPFHLELHAEGLKKWYDVMAYQPQPGQVAMLLADTTARKQAEREVREINERLSTVFRTSPVGISVGLLADGTFVDVNEALEEMLGYQRAEVLGRTGADLRLWVDADDRAAVFQALRSDGIVRNVETRFRKKAGDIIDVSCSGCRVTIAGVDHFIGMVSDISALKDAQQIQQSHRDQLEAMVAARTEELAAARDAADAANLAKSAFLANMSHEIRTPLHVITGLGYLMRHDADDPLQLDRLEHLCETAAHLQGIINDVLDLSKLDAQHLTLASSDFRLATVIDKVVTMIEGTVLSKGLTLTVQVAAPLRDLALNGDPLRLAQVLVNLCGNAVKFTDRGGVCLGVTHLAETSDSVCLRFAVEDTGIGIAAADQVRLFEAFEQLDSSTTRERGGTGLGLTISQRLVGQMGGTITVDSDLGAGSAFSFDLALAHATTSVPEPATAPALPSANAFVGRHVLFAEDHPISQEILLDMLEDLGCTAEVASDGAEAVACAQARRYDVILMDMHMPKMDGLAATRAIRALPACRDTPIIALTANAFDEDRQRCLDAGMNGHLAKPLTPAALAAALGRWLPDLSFPEQGAPPCDTELSRALAAIPGLDVGPTWRRSPAQLASYRSQLQRFTKQHGQDMPCLRGHLAAGDYDAAQVVAHNLKGIAGLIGARRVAALAGEIMQGLRAGTDAVSLDAAVSACEVELAALTEAVRELLPLPEESAAAEAVAA